MTKIYVVDNDGEMKAFYTSKGARDYVLKDYTDNFDNWYTCVTDAKELLSNIKEDLNNIMSDLPFVSDCIYTYEAELKD